MKIESVQIDNFRIFKNQTVRFADYTCLVGPNGGGKSTVFTALNVFFRYVTDAATNLLVLSKEDFHNKDTGSPVRITVTFSDLSTEAQKDFADYFREGKLIVSAVAEWDPSTNTCLLYTSPSPRDLSTSRMPSSA